MERVAGFVLAGGRSSRMGQDKALLEFGGVPLLEIGLRKLRELCAETAIAGGPAELARFGRVIPDGVVGQGPLAGIVAALEQSPREWNLFLPVDVPLIPRHALRQMLATVAGEEVAVLAESEGRVHPLCGVYSRRALPAMQAELMAGRLRVRQAIEAAGEVRLWRAPVEGWLRNVNTPDDFAALAAQPDDLGPGL